MGTERILGPSVRLRTEPAATRMFGRDLLVNAGGAEAPVQRIMGAGVDLWWAFSAGQSIGEATEQMAERTGVPAAEVQTHVVKFATELVRVHLAEPTW